MYGESASGKSPEISRTNARCLFCTVRHLQSYFSTALSPRHSFHAAGTIGNTHSIVCHIVSSDQDIYVIIYIVRLKIEDKKHYRTKF